MGELSLQRMGKKLIPDTFLPVATSVYSGLVTATFAVPADAGTYFTGAIVVAAKGYRPSGSYIIQEDYYFICDFSNRSAGFGVSIGLGRNGYMYPTGSQSITDYVEVLNSDSNGSGTYNSDTRTITLQLRNSSISMVAQEIIFSIAKIKEKGNYD